MDIGSNETGAIGIAVMTCRRSRTGAVSRTVKRRRALRESLQPYIDLRMRVAFDIVRKFEVGSLKVEI
jgi:hypothetical protein